MDEILQKRLFNDFPKIFIEKDLPMQQTCMCWGICTDDGWFVLLHELCSYLQWYTDKNKYPQVIAQQVKEKFGTLRFYYSYNIVEDTKLDEEDQTRMCAGMDGAIQFAESMSSRICEVCGAFNNTVELMSRGGWCKTLCTVCAEPLNYKPFKLENPIENAVTFKVPIPED